MKNPYAILGVEKTASGKEIKKAYHKLAMEWHPDKKQGDKQAEEKFKEISSAYEVLSNSEKRKQYDTYGDLNPRHQESGIDDILRNMGFGGGRGFNFDDIFGSARGGRRVRGEDLRKTITIDFLEAAKGGSKSFKMHYPIICVSCTGNGSKNGKSRKVCDPCKGSGRTTYKQGFMQVVNSCNDCGGSGFQILEFCKDCNGAGEINKEESVKIIIPAGVDENTTMRLSGKGLPSEFGGENGDLFISLIIKPHSKFKRMGTAIQSEETIDYLDAILGTKIDVETIHGTVKLDIPAGIQPNNILKIKNEGIHKDKNKGDHLVNIKVSIPKQISNEQKELLLKIKENR